MNNVKCIFTNDDREPGARSRGSLGFGGLRANNSYSTPDLHKPTTVEDPATRIFRFVRPKTAALIKDHSYASAFNSWVNIYSLETFSENIIVKNIVIGTLYRCVIQARYSTPYGVLKVKGIGIKIGKNEAREEAYKEIMTHFIANLPTTQMDTEQGDVIQDSDKQSNTIVTRDAAQSKSEEMQVMPHQLPIICSTEPVHTFDSVMNRWMALDGLEVKATMKANDMVETYNLPSFLYKANKSPNLMPLENFVYGSYDVEFKFVVNANKFHVGKVICHLKYDSYQMEERRNNIVSALCRPHVILDLAVNNEGVLSVPFKYHRTFVRNAKLEASQHGLKHAQYASVYVQILSPLGAIAGAPQSMFIRPFYRIKQAKLTGMSYRVALAQMDNLNLEGLLKAVGTIANLDRPTDLQRQTQVIPKTRLHFCAGKGPIDAVPMRLDPSALTTYLPDHHFPEDPTDMLQIAKIWGLAFTFNWKTSDAEGATLVNQAIDPTYHCPIQYTGTPTPLEYVCSMYQFWSGPIEVRLDFVSNAFHSGSVMLSAEFGRTGSDLSDSSATYTKTFHLGDQKSCTFTIPYIYDTPYRRTSCVPWCPLGRTTTPEADVTRLGSNALYPSISARFKVRVINKLVPIQSVTQNITVLCYWRAGDNFTCCSPIMANLTNAEVSGTLNTFPGKYPTTQMDTGEKEDLDPTHDFSQGISRHNLMSSDKHTNIKDLLRRPVQIIHKYAVSKYNAKDSTVNITCIPCMPPSRMCCAKRAAAANSLEANGFYTKGLIRSYHTHILDLFRFWRGSQRFTFLFYTSSPVFIAYVPHSGARVPGDINYPTVNLMIDGKGYPSTNPSTMGLPTEIVLPNINRSVVIEAPFELETNFALMQEKYNEDNYSWRDKGETNAGHIMIWSDDDITMDVWWSAGDDFEVSNFYGIPPCESFTHPFYKNDNYPKPQMDDEFYDAEDFLNPEHSELTSNLITKLRDQVEKYKFPALVSTLPFVPIVGPTLAMGVMADRAQTTLDKVDNSVVSITGRTNNLLDRTNDNITNISKVVVTELAHTTERINNVVAQADDLVGELRTTNSNINALVEDTQGMFQELARMLSLQGIRDSASDIIQVVTDKVATVIDAGSALYRTIVNIIIDIFMNLIEFNYKTLALSIVRFVVNIVGLTISKVSSFIQPITDFIKSCFSATTQGDPATEHLSAGFWSEDLLKQGLGLFVGLIGTVVGISVDKKDQDSWSASTMKRVCSAGGMSFLNGSMRFVETIFNMIKEAIFFLVGYVSIENKALIMMREKSAIIDNFVKESQLMLNEANLSAISNPDFKIRFWTNVVNAYEIQRVLAQLPSNKVAPILSKMCTDVIKVGKEKMADLKSSPVRYEPFVICISGPSKIGKSFVTTPLATELLHAIGHKSSSNNPIYYRIQGSKFWNDYTDQPCVVIDEWMNLSDPQSVMEGVREMFQLKSPAVFIPEQAAIEEKKIRANPKLVIILTNTPFPDELLTSAVTHTEAVYRRRDILLHADLTNEARQVDLHSMPVEDKKAFKHLSFKVYDDVTRATSLNEVTYTYDGILTKLKEEFVKYDRNESENVKIRMAELQKFWQTKTLNMTDPFSLFYQGIIHINSTQDKNLPSEMLELEIAKLTQAVNAIEEGASQEVAAEGWMGGLLCMVGVWSVKKLVEYLADYKPSVPTASAECCVCHERQFAYACCGTSFKTFEKTNNASCLHIVCRICCMANQMVQYRGCPLCNDPEYLPIIPSDSLTYVKGLWRLKKLGMSIKPYLDSMPLNIFPIIQHTVELLMWFAAPFVSNGNYEIYNCMTSDISSGELLFKLAFVGVNTYMWKRDIDDKRAELPNKIRYHIEKHLEAVERLGTVVPECDLRLYREKFICPDIIFYENLEHLPLLKDMDKFYPRKLSEIQSHHMVALGLTEYEFTGKEHIEVQPQMETIAHRRLMFRRPDVQPDVNYHFNQELFERDWAVLKESEVCIGDIQARTCIHADFHNNIRGARWEDGVFMVPTNNSYVRTEWKKCKTFCCLSEMNLQSVCQAYFDHYKHIEYTYITNHYTSEEFKENWNKRLPSFMFPQWLDIQAFTVKEDEGTWLSKLTIPGPLMLLLKGVGISLSVFIAFKGIKSISELIFGEQATSQIISSGDSVVRKFKPEIRQVKHVIAASQSDCGAAIMSKVVNNYFIIRVKNKTDNTIKMCVGIGIKQRIGLLPRHYYEWLCELDHNDYELTLGPAIELDHGLRYSFCKQDFLVSEVSDLAVFYLPVSYNMFKDISRYFGTDNDINAKHSPYAQMVRVPTKHERYISIIELQIKGYKKTQTIVGPNGSFTSLDNLEYNYSQPGACGSVIMFHDHTRPIRGIHIAGIGKLYGGTGYAAVVTQEDIEIIPKAPNTVHVQGVEEPEFVKPEVKMYLPPESVVTYKGSVSKELIPFNSDKSAIKPSKIHEDLPWKTTKAPAILSKKDPRYKHSISPLLAGCAKHGYLTKDFPSDQLEEVAAIRKEQLLAQKPLIVNPRKLTIKEAIIGFPGVPHYEGIKMNTSAGWPYCTTNKTTKDKWTKLILNDQQQAIDCELNQEIEEEVKRKEELRKQGIVPMTLFVDTLKDEKKSIEKVQKLGGTRVFCSSPYDFTISMRQNFLHFVAMYYENRDLLKHSVGISMVGREVTQLVTDLLSVGNNIITLDYSNFGPGFNASVAGTFKHTMLEWVKEYVADVDETELECLIEENINSHHIMAGTIYQQRGGSPSGSPLTVVINSEENITYIMLAWLNIVTPTHDKNRWDEFDKHVVLRVYGDDLIMSVSDEYIEQFNGETIMKFFQQYGIVATDASKSSSIVKHTGIYEASYLKHTFRPHPTRKGEWIAALDMISVKDTPLWIQEPIQIDEATRVNAEAAIRNAYGHGPEFFNEFRDIVNKALRKHNIKPILLTWKELDDNFYPPLVY